MTSPKTSEQSKHDQKGPEEPLFINPEEHKMALENAKLGLYSSVLSSLLVLMAVIGFTYFVSVRNEVVLIPTGEMWEYPFVNKIFVSAPQEERRKLATVAMRYIKSIYEINAADYTKIKTDDGSYSIASKAAEMLNYVPVGTQEYSKVIYTIKQSQYYFEQFSECQCRIKFFPEEMRIIDLPGTPFKRVEFLGFFEALSKDNQRPIPAEYVGHKLISLMMMYESSVHSDQMAVATVFDQKQEMHGEGIKDQEAGVDVKSRGKTSVEASLNVNVSAKNPEGWMIVRSSMDNLSDADREQYINLRYNLGLKEVR